MSVISIYSFAGARTNWDCRCKPEGVGDEFLSQNRLVEADRELHLFNDEYTAKPTIYRIMENSRDGLIAVRHAGASTTPRVVGLSINIILLNKSSGHFRMFGYLASSSFEDAYVGNCER
jgi:hypothetical protein